MRDDTGRPMAIKMLKAAPADFSLDHYASLDCPKFRLRHWGQQIAKRHFLHFQLDWMKASQTSGSKKEHFGDGLSSSIHALIASPLRKYDYHAPVSALRPLRFSELTILQNLFMAEADGGHAADDPRGAIDDGQLLPDSGRQRFRHIVIDLNFQNRLIIDALDSYLRKERSSSQYQGSGFDRNKVQDWIDRRILPYWDLMLWSLWRGQVFDDESVEAIIFPEGLEPSSVGAQPRSLAKTRKKAEEIVTLEIAHALIAIDDFDPAPTSEILASQ